MAVTISETLTDNQLLEKIGQGDQLSFETLFRRHYGRVYGLIFRLVGDPQEAEDIAQEVFIRLYQRPPRRRQTHNVAAWLYRVATNRAYNAIRGRKRLWQRNTLLVKSESEGDPGPEPELLAKEERARVTAALLQLKPQQVQLLLLRQMGLSYAELAESCHIRPNSVGKTLERAANAFSQGVYSHGDQSDEQRRF